MCRKNVELATEIPRKAHKRVYRNTFTVDADARARNGEIAGLFIARLHETQFNIFADHLYVGATTTGLATEKFAGRAALYQIAAVI